MAISATDTSALSSSTGSAYENPKGILGKDDFLKLLLVQLQYQDPTEPTDTEQILTQTSQLASLEATDNTNKALEKLAASLGSAQEFSTIAAIGKTADLGSNAMSHEKSGTSSFEVYFPDEITSGNIEILNAEGNIIHTLPVQANKAGVYKFDWDGKLANGSEADSGVYYVTASYKNPAGKDLNTRMGTYPIESVRFENGKSLLKVGSNYVPLEKIKEIF